MPQERSYSEGTAEAVDRAVRVFVDQAFALATQVLQRNRALLDRTAAALLQTETLNEPELEQMRHEILPAPASLLSPVQPAAAAES
jgi:cell division protease FtsH